MPTSARSAGHGRTNQLPRAVPASVQRTLRSGNRYPCPIRNPSKSGDGEGSSEDNPPKDPISHVLPQAVSIFFIRIKRLVIDELFQNTSPAAAFIHQAEEFQK